MSEALASLPPKRRAFVEAFCGAANGNATEAARMAGYKSPDPEGSRLLGNARVADAIAEIREKVSARAISTAEERQAWLSDVVKGLVDDRDGPASLRDRMKALELLCRMRGEFNDRSEVKHEGGGGVVVALTLDKARRLAAEED